VEETLATPAAEPDPSGRFPGESAEYRHAREDLLAAEVALRRQEELVAAQRRRLPLGGPIPTDYLFEEWDAGAGGPRTVRLSQLFDGDDDTLLIYSFMFDPDAAGQPLQVACPLCTSMLDGLDGELPHLTQRISVAVATKAPLERFLAHAHTRGWRHARLLSSAKTTYNRDYLAEASDTEQRPMATVFVRRDGAIRHFWSSELLLAPLDATQGPRHVDFMWPLWSILDRTPGGRGDTWMPELRYP
jgi:predicted dithiol-disulfide oxidoreductase (DUF899 family)